MKNVLVTALILMALNTLTACSKPCDANTAQNRLLVFGKIQGRVLAKGGDGLTSYGLALGQETGPASELIAQGKYQEACEAMDTIAKKYKIDLEAEQKDMLTIEQLAESGGKGSGSCSVADAAKKQMELHALLQIEVDAGRQQGSIFERYNEDTRGFAGMLTTDPSKACALIDSLKKKYEIAG